MRCYYTTRKSSFNILVDLLFCELMLNLRHKQYNSITLFSYHVHSVIQKIYHINIKYQSIKIKK